jgi:hypothetical protein
MAERTQEGAMNNEMATGLGDARVVAAVVAGAVALATALLTAGVTIFVARRNIRRDFVLADKKSQQDLQDAERRIKAESQASADRMSHELQLSNRQLQEANKRPFLEKQLELCLAASDAAARLATQTELGEWQKARAEFLRLYWGPLAIVEDPKVESAMVEFAEALAPLNAPGTSPGGQPLSKLSFNLAHRVRDLILTSWGIKLPNLPSRTSH